MCCRLETEQIEEVVWARRQHFVRLETLHQRTYCNPLVVCALQRWLVHCVLQFKVKMVTEDDDSVTDIIVEGDVEEIDRFRRVRFCSACRASKALCWDSAYVLSACW